MRTSSDEYILPSGEIIAVNQTTEPPLNAKLYNGYDYVNQYWVFKGQRDTRTLEQLKASLNH